MITIVFHESLSLGLTNTVDFKGGVATLWQDDLENEASSLTVCNSESSLSSVFMVVLT